MSEESSTRAAGRVIREVWATNLEAEFDLVRAHAERYPYVAMDTEFPGVVVRPIGNFSSLSEFTYQTLRSNVDILRLIQLGLTFCDESGEFAEECPTWQFNFRFSLEEDVYAAESIALLQRSGLDFACHQEKGIEMEVFGELLTTSGLVLCEGVKWITFHSAYDFGYLLKILTNTTLPLDEETFLSLLHTYFPTFYDIKQLLSLGTAEGYKGGLQRLGDELKVERVGKQHQAGSDSMLTSSVFFKLMPTGLKEKLEEGEGLVFGLGASSHAYCSLLSPAAASL